MSSSREIIESQVSQIDLLQAMYPGDNEVHIDDSTRQTIDALKAWCFDDGSEPQAIPQVLTLTVCLAANAQKSLNVVIDVPLHAHNDDVSAPEPPKVRIRQPDWMTRAEVSALTAQMPRDDLFTALDFLQSELQNLPASQTPTAADAGRTHLLSNESGGLVRVWFYFPSLSTRAKRDDLVYHAPAYALTGFVLAGKPGVLCLEGLSERIDAYMKFIKTESWGDIPSHHKKVSERYREDGIERVFGDMREITDELEKRGERANRGDMKALEAWLTGMGLGDAFSQVLL